MRVIIALLEMFRPPFDALDSFLCQMKLLCLAIQQASGSLKYTSCHGYVLAICCVDLFDVDPDIKCPNVCGQAHLNYERVSTSTTVSPSRVKLLYNRF